MKTTLAVLLIALALIGCTPAPAATPASASEAQSIDAPKLVRLPTNAPAPTQAPPPMQDTAPGNPSQLAYAPSASSLVIKDAEIQLLVRDSSLAVAQVTQLAADHGGYIVSSQSWYTDGFLYASLRLGIPSLEFERALNAARRLAHQVLRETASGQDVSADYVDLQSKLTNLEATSGRVREFLKDARTVEESLTINQQLADLETQIEQIKGQMRFYEGRSAFSTLTVLINPLLPTPTPTGMATATPTPTPTPAWDAGKTFDKAGTTLVSILKVVIDFLIWLVVLFGPFLVVIGGLAFLLRTVLRKAGQTRAKPGDPV